MAKKFPSELRFDLVSKDWVVIATGRAKRPEAFRKEARITLDTTKKHCPFEDITDDVASIPNKYPAFFPSQSMQTRIVGPYQVMDGVGFHEVIVTKDHTKDIPQFSISQVRELIDMYQSCYVVLMEEEFVNYIAIFKNKGPAAGATVAHPHSQLIATPLIDPDIDRSLRGSAEYFAEKKKCVHCTMLEYDRKEKKRVLFENDRMVVVCPFASRVAFEMRIFPKKHAAFFEHITEQEKIDLADALHATMKKLHNGLKDPDYNYFLHTAPADGKDHNHYHWHWEILPRTSTWAGFELGTGIEISTIEPEKAATFLRKQ